MSLLCSKATQELLSRTLCTQGRLVVIVIFFPTEMYSINEIFKLSNV